MQRNTNSFQSLQGCKVNTITCPICLDTSTDFVVAPCRHGWCKVRFFSFSRCSCTCSVSFFSHIFLTFLLYTTRHVTKNSNLATASYVELSSYQNDEMESGRSAVGRQEFSLQSNRNNIEAVIAYRIF